MSKHTPGPWEANSRRVYSALFIIADTGSAVGPEERAANAKLIASSPDLLAAIIAATERMEAVAAGILVENRAKGVSQATHVRHMAGHLAQHAKIARAAIAKATT